MTGGRAVPVLILGNGGSEVVTGRAVSVLILGKGKLSREDSWDVGKWGRIRLERKEYW